MTAGHTAKNREWKEYGKPYRQDILLLLVILVVFTALAVYRVVTGGEYSGDEFFSLKDTMGYAYTGKTMEWDFHTNGITDVNVGLPFDFRLLGWWMRLVGTNIVLLRGLSAVYGALAVISFYYVVRRLTGSTEWTALAAILLATNAIMLNLSSIVRGYTLLLLLNIWIFYFIYRALQGRGGGEPKSRAGTFLRRWLDFDYRYAVPALVLICLAYSVRIFELFYLIGIGVFILLKAVTGKEKRYLVTAGVFWGAFILLIAAYILHLERYLPALRMITGRLEQYASIGLHHIEYIWDMAAVCRFFPLTIAGLALLAALLPRKDGGLEGRQRDVVLYMASVVICTVVLFVAVVDWQHDRRYLFVIEPALFVMIAAGFYLAGRRFGRECRAFLYGILLFGIGINIYGVCLEPWEEGGRTYYTQAYEKVAEYLQGKPAFITGIYLRGYYARDILPDYIWRPMTSKGDGPDGETNNLAELSEIGREYPQGILTCEEEKWYHFRNTFWMLLQTDAFERITGGELDETQVGNWAYHFCYPTEGGIPEGEGATTLFGYNYGGASRVTEADGKTVVELELNGSAPEQTLLCIKVNQYYAGEKKRRYVQLVLEPNGRDRQYYRIELENDSPPDRSALDDSYCIYQNGKEPERYEDCYSL